MTAREPLEPGDTREMDPPPGPLTWLLARAVGFLLGGREAQAPPAPSELRRVLVVRPDDRVGNALLTIPLARALQQRLPLAQIDLLLASRRALVADGLPGLGIVRFEKRDLYRHPIRFLRALWRLRGYDAAVDASHWHSFSLTAALLARWASRRFVVSTDRGPAKYLSTVALPLPPADLPDSAAKLELLRGLGLAAADGPVPLETALGADERAIAGRDAMLARLGLRAGGYAALNVGARKLDHRWPALSFGKLAAALRDKHALPSLILWGPGEEALAEEARAAAVGAAQVAPATDLEALAALFRGARLVVTGDTGPLHLAVACGAPVLALQRSRDAVRWSHAGPRFEGVPASGESLQAALEAAGRLLALTARGAASEGRGGPASVVAGPEAK